MLSEKEKIMHTLHHIAIEAESKEHAIDLANNILIHSDSKVADWSDWLMIGGGRWNPTDNPLQGVTSFAEDPDKFVEILDSAHNSKCNQVRYLLDKVNLREEIDRRTEAIFKPLVWPRVMLEQERTLDMEGYYLQRVMDLINHRYTPDSYYYDGEEYTSDMEPVLKRIDNADSCNKQYLVAVDFHY